MADSGLLTNRKDSVESPKTHRSNGDLDLNENSFVYETKLTTDPQFRRTHNKVEQPSALGPNKLVK